MTRLSPLQFGTLKYLRSHDVQVEHIRSLSQTTVGSLLVRGYIQRSGTLVVPTKKGYEAFDEYNRAEANFRKSDSDISDRVSLMLNLRFNKHASINS